MILAILLYFTSNPFLIDVVADYEPLRKRIENEKIRNSDVDDEKKE